MSENGRLAVRTNWKIRSSDATELKVGELYSLVRDAVGAELHRARELDEYYDHQRRSSEVTAEELSEELFRMWPNTVESEVRDAVDSCDEWEVLLSMLGRRLVEKFDIRRKDPVN